MQGTHRDCGRMITDNLIGRNVTIFSHEQNLPEGTGSSSETYVAL